MVFAWAAIGMISATNRPQRIGRNFLNIWSSSLLTPSTAATTGLVPEDSGLWMVVVLRASGLPFDGTGAATRTLGLAELQAQSAGQSEPIRLPRLFLLTRPVRAD